MHYKRTIIFCFLLSIAISGNTQDIHFSQFYSAPLQLNPALAGSMEKELRINGNERTQWSQVLRGDSYNAYNLAIDRKIKLKNGAALGVGLNGFLDRAGELNFGSTQGHLSVAYHKNLGKDSLSKHTLSLAAEFGIAKRIVDPTNSRWPSQNEGNSDFLSSFSPDFLHPDLGIGANWNSNLSSSFSFAIGAVVRHLNRAKISFYGDESNRRLTPSYTIHAQADWQIGTKTSLMPRLLFKKQEEYTELTSGIELGFDLRRSVLSIGQYFRTNNDLPGGVDAKAAITTFSMAFKVFRFGVSYDIPTSNLRQAGGFQRALEVTTAVML